MTGALLNTWPLLRGGRLVFIANDDGLLWSVDHMGRHDDSCARIADALPREDAEAAADDWLRAENKFRLVLLEGGRA